MDSFDSSCPALDAVISNYREATNEAEVSSSESNGPTAGATTSIPREIDETEPSESEPSHSVSDDIIGSYRGAANEAQTDWSVFNTSADSCIARQIRQMHDHLVQAEVNEAEEYGFTYNGVLMRTDDDDEGDSCGGDLVQYDSELDLSDAMDDDDDIIDINDDDDLISLFHYGNSKVPKRLYNKIDAYLSDGMSDDEDDMPIDSDTKENSTEQDRFNDIMDDYLNGDGNHNCSCCSF